MRMEITIIFKKNPEPDNVIYPLKIFKDEISLESCAGIIRQ